MYDEPITKPFMNLRHIILPAIIFSTVITASAAGNPFVGMWQPDMEATLENARKNPKFKKEDFEKMEQILPQMIGPMRMQLTPSAFTMKFGKSRQQTAPYTAEAVNETKGTFLIHPPGQEKPVRATFTRIAPDQMTLQIEGNNDMDLYVWKPAESMEAEDMNVAAIVGAVMGGKLKKEADQVPQVSVEDAIRKNLSIIASCAEQYMLEEGKAEASFKDLEGEYFKVLRAVNGESYNDLTIKSGQEAISVTDQDGKTHILKLR